MPDQPRMTFLGLSSNLNLQMRCNYLILRNVYQKRANLLKAQVTSHYNAVKRHRGAFYEFINLATSVSEMVSSTAS